MNSENQKLLLNRRYIKKINKQATKWKKIFTIYTTHNNLYNT